MASMARSITIRNVPERTARELSARASATRRSLQEYLRGQLIDLARWPEPEAWVARVRERKERTGSRLPPESILAHREADRR